MAATFLQAMKARYDEVQPATGLPAMAEGAWVGVIPEGKIRTPPNVCFKGGKQTFVYQQDLPDEDAADGELAMTTAPGSFYVYAAGLAATEALAKALTDGFRPRSLAIDGMDVTLYRTGYEVTDTGQRGPAGEFVFRAKIDYMAQFNAAS